MKSTPTGPIVEVRDILTRDGTLTVQMTQTFIDRIRKHLNLGSTDALTDDDLKAYLLTSVRNAVDKAERHVTSEPHV